MTEAINNYCKALRLAGVMKNYPACASDCAKKSMSYSEFLLKILESENTERTERSKKTILRFAGFPVIKTLEMFDFASSNVNKTQISELSSLKFIERAENVILVGPLRSRQDPYRAVLGLSCRAEKDKDEICFITFYATAVRDSQRAEQA